MEHPRNPSHLRAIVDMGSNGIRFSISDLSPHTARILPTIYQDRVGISLYDAQYSSGVQEPIPDSTIKDVCKALLHFKATCADFEVPTKHIRVVSTEATREAINSVNFRQTIREKVGWEVELMTKDQEGRTGAMGIASSYTQVHGLVMDLGGGSIQLSWMMTENGNVQVPWSISLPYGAAALSRRLQAASGSEHEREELKKEVYNALISAFTSFKHDTLQCDDSCTRSHRFPLFLSGGGFRGWGHVLMDAHPITPYPIPIINGFSVKASFFHDMPALEAHIASSAVKDSGIFRISSRRQSQLPAISFLISQLVKAVPDIEGIKFAQGGVREGLLFSSLKPETRAQHPLSVATAQYAAPSSSALLQLLRSVECTNLSSQSACPQVILDLLASYTNLLYYFAPFPRETRAAVSLHCTMTGILASVHGVSHVERATLSLLLCQRWGGEVAPTDESALARLHSLVGPQITWWTNFFGRIGTLVGSAYPAGTVGSEVRLGLTAETEQKSPLGGTGKISEEVIIVRVKTAKTMYENECDKLEKVGKRKRWVGGKDGWGIKVQVLRQHLSEAASE